MPTSPPSPEVLDSIARAPVLERFDSLSGFFGAGRKLTAKGHPTLADARKLVDLLLLTDVIDPSIGDKVWQPRRLPSCRS
jgi:hypothetical protein